MLFLFLELIVSFICRACRASVMSGKHAGVQKILRDNYIPCAMYIHCYAHQLNLVVCDVSNVVPYLSEFYAVIGRIHSYFSRSSVTNEWFKSVQKDLKSGETIECLIRTQSEEYGISFHR